MNLPFIAALLLSSAAGPRPTPAPAVRNFEVVEMTATRATLGGECPFEWDTFNDDILVPTRYELYYSIEDPLTYSGDWFATAQQSTPINPPLGPGSAETWTVSPLTPGTQYWFCIRTFFTGEAQGGDSDFVTGTTSLDTEDPESIDTLAVESSGSTAVVLAWSAPADFENPAHAVTLSVSRYELRHWNQPITQANFGQATLYVPSESWTPSAPGGPELYPVVGLTGGEPHWFAIKSYDQVGRPSPVSNVVFRFLALPPPGSGSSTGGGCLGSSGVAPAILASLLMLGGWAFRR